MKTIINVFIGVVAILIGSIILSDKGITTPLVPDKSPTKIIPPWVSFVCDCDYCVIFLIILFILTNYHCPLYMFIKHTVYI